VEDKPALAPTLDRPFLHIRQALEEGLGVGEDLGGTLHHSRDAFVAAWRAPDDPPLRRRDCGSLALPCRGILSVGGSGSQSARAKSAMPRAA